MLRSSPVLQIHLRAIPSRSTTRVFALGLLLCAWAMQLGAARAAEPTLSDFKAARQKSQSAVARITSATVGIINPDMAGPNSLGHGSGVVVSEDGLVLTAAHVLGKPNSELIVVFADGRRVPAIALGADRSRDAGMARITEKGKWPFVELGHSGALKPGDWCLAMGHPGGVQEGRTPPLRLGRILTAGKGTSLHDCIHSDATIISGDSGGPLFDLDGKLIGIHSSISAMFSQNNHVPVDVYHETWKDLVDGKQTGQLPGEQGPPGHLPPEVSPQLAQKISAAAPAASPSGRPRSPSPREGGPTAFRSQTAARTSGQVGSRRRFGNEARRNSLPSAHGRSTALGRSRPASPHQGRQTVACAFANARTVGQVGNGQSQARGRGRRN